MRKKVIEFGLSEREIDRAIKELNAYKQDLLRKTDLLRERVAEYIAKWAEIGFNESYVDDLLNDYQRNANVDVTVEPNGDMTVIIATGEDAIWVEFGAGVYHNGTAGTSPHPQGSSLGFTIGDYGKGYGKRDVWSFKDENGVRQKTHGTPATMPMHNALETVCESIYEIVQEVFG